jgi:hypothetical protein
MKTTLALGAFLSSTLGVLALGCSSGADGETAGTSSDALVVCADAPNQVPAGAWQCGEARTLECTSPSGATPPPLYVRPAQPPAIANVGPLACGDVTLTTSTPASGPYALGHHDVVVTQQSSFTGPIEVCRAELTVRDTTAPVVTARDQEMWPPNHKMHHVAIADCAQAVDACDPAVSVFFTAVTSDEPVDAKGDGKAPDVEAVACGSVDLRSERQGGADGRVYRLFWRAVDASGNAVDGSCRATVPHDQSGRPAVEGAPAYRIDVPAGCK